MYRLIILFSIGARVLQYHGVHGRTKFSTRVLVLNFLTSFVFFNPHTIFKIFHIQTLCKSAQEVLKYYGAVSVLQEYRHHKPSITVSLRNFTSQLISNFVRIFSKFKRSILYQYSSSQDSKYGIRSARSKIICINRYWSGSSEH